MPRFAVEIKQLVIVSADDEETARAVMLRNPPHKDMSGASTERGGYSVQTTRKLSVLSCRPFKGRTPRRTGAYR